MSADLVVLSAYDTGLGLVSGEGVVGLTRAWLAAGTRSLLVSLWPISDQATINFMQSFHSEYVRHGQKARALQAASRKARADGQPPEVWAAFQLIGHQQ